MTEALADCVIEQHRKRLHGLHGRARRITIDMDPTPRTASNSSPFLMATTIATVTCPERYLSILTRGVARRWNGKLCYVDLFSGPGRSVIRQTAEEVEGSPLVALNCEFAKYVFVDVADVIDSLEVRLCRHPKLSPVTLIRGDCNEVIDEVRAAAPRRSLNARMKAELRDFQTIPTLSAEPTAVLTC